MCNGNSTRPSHGGSIAILKPIVTPDRPTLRRELSLRLIKNATADKTTAMIEGLEEGQKIGGELFIHRDGDLRSNSNTITKSSILHRIPLPKNVKSGDAFELNISLDLNVGGDGIIGRRVSLVDDKEIIGEGIAGWN